ncbi:hypothetical protein Glove_375g54 [Diversispora epigaea]|uniref:Uncharacterized protein n=1 Tax=Diversispora epigaea TaxID=1348612 RepID=A0A397H8C8_9GLOM|nr:hypothetical protein Glove_375g54 [Diversispora epigaea]
MPATSVPSERRFSDAENVLTDNLIFIISQYVEYNIESLLAAKQIVLDEELSETDSENSKEQDNFIEIQSLSPEISDLDKIDDKTIEHCETKHIMPCAIIDIIDGKIQRCRSSDKLRPLYQLIGMWQVDKNTVEEVNKQLENLNIFETKAPQKP